MGPYLVVVIVEEASNIGVIGVDIDFAGSDDVCSIIAHMAEVIEDVEAIVTEAKAVDVLKIDAEDVIGFGF